MRIAKTPTPEQIKSVLNFDSSLCESEAICVVEEYIFDLTHVECSDCGELVREDDVEHGIEYGLDCINDDWSICPACGCRDCSFEKPSIENWLVARYHIIY